MNRLTRIHLHGNLAEELGREQWELNVKSGAEAMHAINSLTGDGLKRYFMKPKNAYGRYKVLINGKEVPYPYNVETQSFNEDNELSLRRENLDRLDIIPVLEGAGWMEWLGIGLGVLGLWNAESAMAAMLAITLLATSISSLLSEDPPQPDQRMIDNPSSDPTQLANSYLFSGPVNVLNEGGPVPLGYGRLIVGSQVIMSAYDIKYAFVDDAGKVI